MSFFKKAIKKLKHSFTKGAFSPNPKHVFQAFTGKKHNVHSTFLALPQYFGRRLKGSLKHGKFKRNIAKYYLGAKRHQSFTMPDYSDMYGTDTGGGTGYVHNAKTLSQMTGGV